MSAVITIRSVQPADRAEWDVLYQGYAAFYKTTQTPEMRDRVWSWLHDPAQQSEGLVAVAADGTLIGAFVVIESSNGCGPVEGPTSIRQACHEDG